MKGLVGFFRKKAEKEKIDTIRHAMIQYYNTINQGKISIPSFILADIAMKRARACDRLDELYEKLAG